MPSGFPVFSFVITYLLAGLRIVYLNLSPLSRPKSGHSVVFAPATRQRLLFEFLPTVQDAFPSAVVYIIRRDVAKPFVVPRGVVPRDDSAVDPCRADRPNETYHASAKFFPPFCLAFVRVVIILPAWPRIRWKSSVGSQKPLSGGGSPCLPPACRRGSRHPLTTTSTATSTSTSTLSSTLLPPSTSARAATRWWGRASTMATS